METGTDRRRRSAAKLIVIAALIALGAGLLRFGGTEHLSFDYVREHQEELASFYADHRAVTIMVYVIVMVGISGFWGWGQVPLTILAGVIFGRWVGSALAVLSAAAGDVLACWLGRSFVRAIPALQSRQGVLAMIRRRADKDGPFYLFMLRIIPVVPAFLVNVGMALTPISLWTFWWVTVLGTLPGKFLYANTGTELAELSSWREVASPSLIVALVALGVIPLLLRKAIDAVSVRMQARDEGSGVVLVPTEST